MDWRFILGYGSLGLLLGIARLYAWLPWHWEHYAWLGLGFVWVTAAMRKVPQSAFQHVFMTVVLAAFLAGNVQALSFVTYLANNPIPLNETGEPFWSTPSRTMFLFRYLFLGTMFGVFTGLVAALLVRFTGPKPTVEREGPEPATMLPPRPPMDTHSAAAAAVVAGAATEQKESGDGTEEE